MECRTCRGHAIRLTVLVFASCYALAQSPQPLDEMTLGLEYRKSILGAVREAAPTTESNVAQGVFASLLATATCRTGPGLRYNLTLLQSDAVNAYATPGGNIYATSRLAALLGSDRGLWAAVLGHELGHSIKQHFYKLYLRYFQQELLAAYYRERVRQGDTGAALALLGAQVASKLVNLKLSRDDELEADRLALTTMAEAGYHPDFAIALFRKLWKLDEQSKLEAFFSGHPRWETREQRVMLGFDEAVERFQFLWSDSEKSRGGRPPLTATLGAVSSAQDLNDRTAIISVPLAVRHAQGERIWVSLGFSNGNKPIPSTVSEFRASDGSLGAAFVWQPPAADVSTAIVVRVPTAALGIANRKVLAFFTVLTEDELLAASGTFEVSFPK
jgi:hypothetical protein